MPGIDLRSVAVLMFGPPGSGKGTVSKRLVACLDLPHISTGDILREHVQAQDELGRRVKAVMDSGALVPDELVNELVEHRIGRGDCAGGFILDGYPRTVEQARALALMLAGRGLEPMVVLLNVDYDRIVRRLTARRSCPKCGSVYNLVSLPPRREGVCDRCGAALVTRDDDREEVIRQRFDAYEKQSRPLLDYFARSQARFYEVDGNDGSPEEIAERACRLIGGK